MRFFETFAGVAGIGQAFPKEWECVGFSEIDKYASMVLKYHYPNVKNYGDITRINWNEVPDFDVLTGGSPCQDFSIAGKRRGLSGTKSSLAWEFIRGLRAKQPEYFIWENVKGVMSSRGGWDFANILCAFSESGYSLWWQVLNAKDFGVPQNRERIFVIGSRSGSFKEVLFESKDTGEIDQLNNPEHSNERLYDTTGIAPTLNTMQGGHRQPFIVAQRGRNPDNPKSRVSGLPTEQMLEVNLTGNSNTLTSVEKDNYVMEVANCVTPDAYLTHGARKRVDGKAVLTSMHERRIRKLTPKECERLMSWQDDWTRWGTNEKGETVEISDSQRYKMCGNGVVSNCVKALVDNVIT